MQTICSYSELLASIFDSPKLKYESGNNQIQPLARCGAALSLIVSAVEVIVSTPFRLLASLCPPIKPFSYVVSWGISSEKGLINLWRVVLGIPTEDLKVL